MHKDVSNLYTIPNIDNYQDLRLQDLSEHCAALEAKVYAIAKCLPDKERQLLESYIHTRDDLEIESIKAALRWGKQHYL